jgi:hypothetical protein
MEKIKRKKHIIKKLIIGSIYEDWESLYYFTFMYYPSYVLNDYSIISIINAGDPIKTSFLVSDFVICHLT